jgi:hypothetical protein
MATPAGVELHNPSSWAALELLINGISRQTDAVSEAIIKSTILSSNNIPSQEYTHHTQCQ